jgi:hypothetical protein
MRRAMKCLVIFASCLGVGVCVDSGGGGSDGCWNTWVPVEQVGGGACARQVTWSSRGLRGFPGLQENWVSFSVTGTGCFCPPC